MVGIAAVLQIEVEHTAAGGSAASGRGCRGECAHGIVGLASLGGEAHDVVVGRALHEEGLQRREYVAVVDGRVGCIRATTTNSDRRRELHESGVVEAGIGVTDEVPTVVGFCCRGILLELYVTGVVGKDEVTVVVLYGRYGEVTVGAVPDVSLAGMEYAVVGHVLPGAAEVGTGT